MEAKVPILIKLTYTDLSGKVVRDVGPEELYFPNVKSSKEVNNKLIIDTLEEELEEYRPESFSIDWEVISESVN